MTVKVVSWNIAGRVKKVWQQLLGMDADVALLQEVRRIPEWVVGEPGVGVGPKAHFDSHVAFAGDNLFHVWSMVVKLSDRVEVEWFKQVAPVSETRADEFAVSGIGTAAAARVIPANGEPFVVVSMYGRWIACHPTVKGSSYPDSAVHRIVSDLAAFIGSHDPSSHRILAAGDLNMSFRSSHAFDHRAQTVLDRMEALGMEYVGPTHPHGRRADPIPPHLTEASLDVPTYHSNRSGPTTAQVQLDHVFASRGLHHEVRARALNEVEQWGGSDHCRVVIEVGGGGSG